MTALHWLIPWEPSILVDTALAMTSLAYLRGSRFQRAALWRRISFWLGILSVYVVSQTELDYYAEHEFFMHRLQHSMLHHLSPFLIALSRPGKALLAGLPVAFTKLWRSDSLQRPLRMIAAIINQPLVAITLFCGLTVLWLIPSVHFIVMIDGRWYSIMNWCMAVNGLMFWNLTLNNTCLRPARLSPGTRILMLLAVIPPQIIIGALLFFSAREWYPVYNVCGRAFLAINPLADQQIGGLIIWIHGGMMSVLGILVIARREWIAREPKPSNA